MSATSASLNSCREMLPFLSTSNLRKWWRMELLLSSSLDTIVRNTWGRPPGGGVSAVCLLRRGDRPCSTAERLWGRCLSLRSGASAREADGLRRDGAGRLPRVLR